MKQENLSTIKNILTLRYDPTNIQSEKKITANNFKSKNVVDLEIIEKNIEKIFREKIHGKNVTIALSGGIDSVLLLALLRKTFPKIKIDAISIKFVDSVDETKVASVLAKKFNANHHIITIDNFFRELPKALSIIKMPFWDIHWYYLSKTSSQFSNILISGDGGDEFFGGYSFRYDKFLSNSKQNMSLKEKCDLYLECHERDWVPDQSKIFGDKINFSWEQIFEHVIPNFDNDLDDLDKIFLADINGKLLYNWIPINSRFHKYFKISSVTPLLTDEIINYALSLDNSLKYNRKEKIGKIPLRKIVEKFVNSEEMTKNKQGFSVNTINLWKNHGKKLCLDYLSDARVVRDGWINEKWIKTHLENDKIDNDVRYVNKFLGLLAFEIWYRIFITKEMDPETKL